MSLREEIGVRPDPEFDLELPRGWARHEVDDTSLRTLTEGIRQRCMQEHRPDLFAQMKHQLDQTWDDMRRSGVFAFFAPTDPGPATVAVPSSINASIRTADPGETLDDMVRSLITERGATPLNGDPRTLRFETERTTRVGEDTVISHSAVYLTPIPGSNRRRALALVAGFARTPDTPVDDPALVGLRSLFDACVATLSWREPSAT